MLAPGTGETGAGQGGQGGGRGNTGGQEQENYGRGHLQVRLHCTTVPLVRSELNIIVVMIECGEITLPYPAHHTLNWYLTTDQAKLAPDCEIFSKIRTHNGIIGLQFDIGYSNFH